MAKISFTLKNITKEIKKAEKKLLALRKKVTKADVRKIDLNLRMLEKSYRLLRIPCSEVKARQIQLPFGQWFTTNPK